MTQIFAQPYDITAYGFYFETAKEYQEKTRKLLNSSGWPVEEFEIQFIDGEMIDAKLFRALDVSQCNFEAFLEAIENWDYQDKVKVIIAVGEAGYNFDFRNSSPNDFDIDLYQMDSLRELAEQFVEEGLFGEIPDNIRYYLDYDAIGRDLATDYSITRIDGTNYVYRCG